MKRNIIIDFNYKGIARHRAYIIEDLNKDLDSLPNNIIESYKKYRDKDLELVGITEIFGKSFNTPQELEKAAMSPPQKGTTLKAWYHDAPAGLKTIRQEPDNYIREYKKIHGCSRKEN